MRGFALTLQLVVKKIKRTNTEVLSFLSLWRCCCHLTTRDQQLKIISLRYISISSLLSVRVYLFSVLKIFYLILEFTGQAVHACSYNSRLNSDYI